jgi:meso-butanediol dehydrogenase/(S,S)-butanediol dehydrogenase/diacetyl reductase
MELESGLGHLTYSTLVHPGDTWEEMWESLTTYVPDVKAREFSEGILVGRPATPEDIAPIALFLASSDSDYITGQVVMVDGGMVLV